MKFSKLKYFTRFFILTGGINISCAALASADAGKSLLVIVGDSIPQVHIGQKNHCTEMQEVHQNTNGEDNRLDIVLTAGEKNWVSLMGKVNGEVCESIISFVPESKIGYIARLSKVSCNTELFTINKGSAPVLKKLANESDINRLVCTSAAGSNNESRLAIIGEDSRFLVGDKGFCGDMKDFDGKDKSGAILSGNQRNWVRLVYHPGFGSKCEVNFSFVPTSGQSYFVRSDANFRRCGVRMFHVLPAGSSAPENITSESMRSCLFDSGQVSTPTSKN